MLNNAYSDGFSAKTLARLTNVPEELILRCDNGELLSMEEIRKISSLQYLLEQLYLADIENGANLKYIVEGLENFFSIPGCTIASYIGLTEDELNVFTENPADYNNYYNLSLKLMHLFTTIVRIRKQ